MTEKEIYIEIAERFILSCQDHLGRGVNILEVVGFKNYHAFESIGGAVNCHLGSTVPRAHARKLTSFVTNYQRNSFASVNPATIATLAIVLNSMRNKYLYPEKTPAGHKSPKEQITLTQARQLTSQINGLIQRLKREM